MLFLSCLAPRPCFATLTGSDIASVFWLTVSAKCAWQIWRRPNCGARASGSGRDQLVMGVSSGIQVGRRDSWARTASSSARMSVTSSSPSRSTSRARSSSSKGVVAPREEIEELSPAQPVSGRAHQYVCVRHSFTQRIRVDPFRFRGYGDGR